jgi:hypothetical protein
MKPAPFALLLRLWLVTCVAGALAASAQPAAAHGDMDPSTLQLDRAPVGPYALSVWTSPAPARAGSLHVSAAVAYGDMPHAAMARFMPQADMPACTVRVEVTPLDGKGPGGSALATVGTNTFDGHLMYEADLPVPAEGRYQVAVTVDDAYQQGGTAGFSLDVLSVTAYVWIIYALAVQAAVVGVWLLKEGVGVWQRALARG